MGRETPYALTLMTLPEGVKTSLVLVIYRHFIHTGNVIKSNAVVLLVTIYLQQSLGQDHRWPRNTFRQERLVGSIHE